MTALALLAAATAHGLIWLLIVVVVACLLAAFVYWVLLEVGLPRVAAACAALLVFLIVLAIALG